MVVAGEVWRLIDLGESEIVGDPQGLFSFALDTGFFWRTVLFNTFRTLPFFTSQSA